MLNYGMFPYSTSAGFTVILYRRHLLNTLLRLLTKSSLLEAHIRLSSIYNSHIICSRCYCLKVGSRPSQTSRHYVSFEQAYEGD